MQIMQLTIEETLINENVTHPQLWLSSKKKAVLIILFIHRVQTCEVIQLKIELKEALGLLFDKKR